MSEATLPLYTELQLPEAKRSEVSLEPLHDSGVVISTEAPIYDNNDLGIVPNPLEGISVVGELELYDHRGTGAQLAIVKSSYNQEDRVYVAGITWDEDGNATIMPRFHWVELEVGRPLTIGRNKPFQQENTADGTRLMGKPFSAGISGKHISLSLNSGRVEINDTSSNGSAYRGNVMPKEESYDFSPDHTMTAEDAARLQGLLRKDGPKETEMFAGRPTIGRDTFPIDGHVDIRSWVAGGEAIVVDSKKYPKEFNELRASLDSKLEKAAKIGLFQKNRNASLSVEEIINAIYETVNEAMSYDMAFVNAESEDVASGNNGHRKAALNNYLMAGKGVCRHMALAVSWLGGDAFERGMLNGRFTTEVNQSDTGRGAHEWSRYVDTNSGEVYIIDVAQHFVGKLADTLDKKPSGREYWGYFRNKEERDAYRQVKLAGKLIEGAGIIPSTLNNKIISSEDIPR